MFSLNLQKIWFFYSEYHTGGGGGGGVGDDDVGKLEQKQHRQREPQKAPFRCQEVASKHVPSEVKVILHGCQRSSGTHAQSDGSSVACMAPTGTV